MLNQVGKTNQVGIIGGGQLALMLADSALALGYKPMILAENSDAPAAQGHPGAIFGSLDDGSALECLFAQVDRVVFENEFVDCEKLALAATGRGVRFIPGLDVIRKTQDKLQQKIFLEELGIPSAEYRVLDLGGDLVSQLKKFVREFPTGCVLKWSRLGYDGKGVLILNSASGYLRDEDLFLAGKFCEDAIRNQSRVYVEEKVCFRKELALIGVLSIRGEFLAYPLVISEQRQGICHRVYGPAISFGLDDAQEQAAQNYAQRIAKALGLYGAFGIEFFETQGGNLVVNEIAPRVHNTGHYTQDACVTSQFENHWRAVLGLKLGDVHFASGFAMLNVLGPDFSVRSEQSSILPEPGARTHLHWYGKKEIRARRKLGHLNAVVNSAGEVKQVLVELENCYQQWVSLLA